MTCECLSLLFLDAIDDFGRRLRRPRPSPRPRDGWPGCAGAGGCWARRASNGTRQVAPSRMVESERTSHDGGSPGGFEARGTRGFVRHGDGRRPETGEDLGLKGAFYEVGAEVSPSLAAASQESADISVRTGPAGAIEVGRRRATGTATGPGPAPAPAVIKKSDKMRSGPRTPGSLGSSRRPVRAATRSRPGSRGGKSGSGLDFRPPIVEEKQDGRKGSRIGSSGRSSRSPGPSLRPGMRSRDDAWDQG